MERQQDNECWWQKLMDVANFLFQLCQTTTTSQIQSNHTLNGQQQRKQQHQHLVGQFHDAIGLLLLANSAGQIDRG
jgi:hypothetical protein